MKRFWMYAALQLKRAVKLLPQMFLSFLLLLLAAALIAHMLIAMRSESKEFQKTIIAVVTEEDDKNARTTVRTVRNFDASKNEVSFELMNEEEARSKLLRGEITAYMLVPGDFLDTMYSQDIHPIRCITRGSDTGLSKLLTVELFKYVAVLMTETEVAEYGALQFAWEQFPEQNPYTNYSELLDRYVYIALQRDNFFTVETIGLSDSLSFAGYYFCALFTAVMMILGLGAGPYFSRRGSELSLLLRRNGLGAFGQVLGEMLPFYLVSLLFSASAALIAHSVIDIPELSAVSAAQLIRGSAFSALPLCAMQFFLYELAPLPPASLMAQFLCAMLQGYVAGCFYPRSFFPALLESLGAATPAGTVITYLSAVLSGREPQFIAPLIWFAAFFALAVLVRKLSRKGGTA